MKYIITFLAVALLGCAAFAMGNPPPLPGVAEVQTKAQAELTSLANDLALVTQKRELDVNSDETIQRLKAIYAGHRSIVDIVTVNQAGYIESVIPATYERAVGQYIGDQDHVIRAMKSEQPVLGGMFKTVEGFYATSLIYPVFSLDKRVIGFISCVFKPDALLGNIIKDYTTGGATIEVLALQTDGRVIYSRDLLQIGKMTFTDPAYQTYTELLSLAARVVKEPSGTGSYSFPSGSVGAPVRKVAQWTTISLYGTEWRLLISKNI